MRALKIVSSSVLVRKSNLLWAVLVGATLWLATPPVANAETLAWSVRNSYFETVKLEFYSSPRGTVWPATVEFGCCGTPGCMSIGCAVTGARIGATAPGRAARAEGIGEWAEGISAAHTDRLRKTPVEVKVETPKEMMIMSAPVEGEVTKPTKEDAEAK